MFFSNKALAKVGVASYSINVWHKLLPVIKEYIDWTNTENLNAICSTKFSSILRKIRERLRGVR